MPWHTMAPTSNVHARSHSLLLLQKLLNLRDGASPLTLVIDNLEQPARPVLSEFVSRAKVLESPKNMRASMTNLENPDCKDTSYLPVAGNAEETTRCRCFHKSCGQRSSDCAQRLVESLSCFQPSFGQGKAHSK